MVYNFSTKSGSDSSLSGTDSEIAVRKGGVFRWNVNRRIPPIEILFHTQGVEGASAGGGSVSG